MNRRLYDNATTVEDEAAILAEFQQRSQHCYATLPCTLNLSYSAHSARAVFDIFPCADAQQTWIFIHGGYWQYCDKSDFAFIAEALLQHGIQTILLEYPLAPQASMDQIVSHIQHALKHLDSQALLKGRVSLVGHSAGAHLAALQHAHPSLDQLLLISGIYDLAPIQLTHLNTALQLSSEQISNYSPILKTEQLSLPCKIIYGALELPELKQQSQAYAAHLTALGSPVEVFELQGRNHYNILDAILENLSLLSP